MPHVETRMLTLVGLVLASLFVPALLPARSAEAPIDDLRSARMAIARADTTGDSETRKRLLHRASLDFLQASAPGPDSPCGDAGRTSPGPGWSEYLSLVRGLVTSETCKQPGVRESFLLLTPRFISRLSDLHFWPRVLYGSQFRAPIDMARDLACSPEEEFIAVAAMADYELTQSWPEACRHYREACALYDSLAVTNEICAPARLAHDLLESEVMNELREIRSQVEGALNLRIEQSKITPPTSAILDGPTLWEMVLPYFAEDSLEHHHPCHPPLAGSFEVSPLSTVPGLRPSGFRSVRWQGKTKHLIQFTETRP